MQRLAILFALAIAMLTPPHASGTDEKPLIDLAPWRKYRQTVQHPAGIIKPADIARARANAEKYEWAAKYRNAAIKSGDALLPVVTPEFVEKMIPETTPGEILFTPCPGCRDAGKTGHPHGQYKWDWRDPDKLVCKYCGTVYPSEKYPESMTIETKWGKPQRFTYYGGEPMKLFSYKYGRSSWTGNIRARKVSRIVSNMESLSLAYVMTGDVKYAEPVRLILLRLAEVYPYWLVHSGYSEVADMDPHVAARYITHLPEDEKVLPPNKPDRKLHTGYWTSGRARAVGMEGMFVRKVATAYDRTAAAVRADGKLLYTDEEREKIERDLLIEGCALLVADPNLNNKSVGGFAATGLVGVVVGHPDLVRVGLNGFRRTIGEWFLPDGYTPESPSYGWMSIGGIAQFPMAMRGYSDPPGYRDEKGERLDDYNLYQQPAYAAVWQGMFNILQGDLHYPPFADSFKRTRISSSYAEIMANNYPDHPEYLSLLKELTGPDLKKAYARWAIYMREPGLEDKPSPPLELPNICPPDLRIGFMRTGARGRDSLLLLSASHWGAHHHYDSLNLYYWKQGREMLSDLGYLWDHPKKKQLMRSVAHNLVVIDEQNQKTRGRGGMVHFFADGPHVRAMQASSEAYPDASLYRRTSGVVEQARGVSYAFDFFEVQGGATQDYVFHGPDHNWTLDGATTAPAKVALYDFEPPASIRPDGPVWRVRWKMKDLFEFSAWMLSGEGETAYIADGWGQRDHKGSDEGVTIPYLVRRTTGDGPRVFAAVYEGFEGTNTLLSRPRPLALTPDAAILTVETHRGTDVIALNRDNGTISIPTDAGEVSSDKPLTVVSIQNGKIVWRQDAEAAPEQ